MSRFFIFSGSILSGRVPKLIILAAIVQNSIFQKLKPIIKETGDRKSYAVNAALHSAENIEIPKNTHNACV